MPIRCSKPSVTIAKRATAAVAMTPPGTQQPNRSANAERPAAPPTKTRPMMKIQRPRCCEPTSEMTATLATAAALVEALELDLPGSVQLGASPLPPLLAEELLRRTPARLERVLFTSTGTEAVEAALKLGRAATRRPRVVTVEHGFHGLTLGSLSANGNAEFNDRFGPLLPGFDKVPFGGLDALEEELRRADVALFLVQPV